ncbi:MAG: hypothetical protein WC821_02690 [archaeon]|jgi:hypothetical protein
MTQQVLFSPKNKEVSESHEQKPKEFLYLTKISYNELKSEMLVEFSNNKERIVKRHKFYPFILLSPSLEKQKISDLVLSLGFRGFSIQEKNNLIYLSASSFSELKKISNSLAIHINKKPLILELERAFLIEKGWSLFSSFEKVGEELFLSNSSTNQNEKDLGFVLTKEIPFSHALKLNEGDALFLVERAAWSELLSIPIEKVPNSKEERTELFLENIFFKHGEMLSFESSSKLFFQKDYDPLSRDATSKIDFSLVWTELFSNTFFNIGPETKNCSCCTPLVLDAKNLLPSSLIRVQFLGDNVFFESSSDNFSFEYHNSMPFKEERASKKKEFFLNSFPVGPFFKGDFAQIPVMDAKRLISEEKVRLPRVNNNFEETNSTQNKINNGSVGVGFDSHELNWFCLNKESFFSKEVRLANQQLFELRKKIDFYEEKLLSKKSFDYFYSKALYSVLMSTLCELPTQLTNTNSKFFSTSLAKSIISVQEATISKFKEFSEKKGYRLLHAGKNFASIKGFSSLKLAKDFSEQTKLPQPEIVSFTRRTAKRLF